MHCPDCGVPPGEDHRAGCDVSQCPDCGEQAVSCGEHSRAGQSRWTGLWPGVVECGEFGWWARWTLTTEYSRDGRPDSGPEERCDPGHPDAHHDLNRLTKAAATGEVVWARDQQRWVKP